MAEKRELSQSGSGGRNSKFKFFDKMDKIFGHRPIVTSLSSVINSSGWCEVIHLNYWITFKGKCGGLS